MKETNQGANEHGLSLFRLIAVIIGSTIGAGIFTTTADMTAGGAHTGAVLIGWGIAGLGMFGLMMAFFGLNRTRPDLTNGIYSYASEGFGDYVGFNSAWGYWLSALLCNVSYTTLLFGAIGYFIPAFGEGNNMISVICASVVIWFMCYLVCRGVQEAAFINIITTACKLIPLFVFIVAIILLRAFDFELFMDNFWGNEGANPLPLGDQIKATTAATVWSFIGVEGAVVLSGRAKKTSDVGKASIIGFVSLLALYVLVAVLSLGVMAPEEMATLKNPQLAGVLEAVVGPWGAALINLGVILSLTGALLGWTIIAAECPSEASKHGVFPKAFGKFNKNDAPAYSLFVTNGIIQLFLIVCYFSTSTYQIFYALSSSMIMIPYLLSAAYYLKLCITDSTRIKEMGGKMSTAWLFAIIGTVYGFWMIYSSGLIYTMITTILYVPGIFFYLKGKKERNEKPFSKPYDIFIAGAFVVLACISVYLIATGKLAL